MTHLMRDPAFRSEMPESKTTSLLSPVLPQVSSFYTLFRNSVVSVALNLQSAAYTGLVTSGNTVWAIFCWSAFALRCRKQREAAVYLRFSHTAKHTPRYGHKVRLLECL